MARTRTKVIPYVHSGFGTFLNTGTTFQDTNQTVKSDKCVDSTGITTDHPLRIDHYDASRLKHLGGTSGIYRYTNFRPGAFSASPVHAPLSLPSIPAAATTAMARTHPGRAEVSLPVFIAELRDLPHALKSIGDLLIKSHGRPPLVKLVSGQYLSWTFGWAPLISDLKKMLDFQSRVDKRTRELERLHSKGGLKRRFSTGSDKVVSDSVLTIESSFGAGLLIRCRKTSVTEGKQWVTIRWKPTDLPGKPVSDLSQLARKAVFGLSLQPSDIWNIMPWTWLIDWFSNVGDFLEAHNNRVPASCGLVNVMTETSTEITYRRVDLFKSISGGDGTVTLVTKERGLSAGGLSIGEGFLNSHQLSILSALAINRLSGR